jgi:tetratricopeptide (TPR) repeat protein
MAKAYLALAVSEYQQGHFGEALMSAQAVGQNQPSSKELANAVDLIGKIQAQLRKLGKDPGTGAQLTTAAPVAASPSLDMITRANRLKEQGKHELFASHFPEAVRWFRDSVALDPAPGTYYDLAIAELQMNDLQQALHDAKQVLAHHPDERQTRLATELEEKIRSEMSKQGLSPLSD